VGSGYFTLGHWRGAPIRLHWSVLLVGVWFGRDSIARWLALFALILLHELGHATFVRYFRHRVVGIYLTGLGGVCSWSGNASAIETAAIAWGGIAAQALLYAATTIFVLVTGGPSSRLEAELVDVFTRTNAWLMAINLLPFPPLDGAHAWSLFRLLRQRREGRPSPFTAVPPDAEPRRRSAPDRSEDDDDDEETKRERERERRFQKIIDDLEPPKPDDPRFKN
jgi:stage IV sporulation protein FB